MCEKCKEKDLKIYVLETYLDNIQYHENEASRINSLADGMRED